MAGFERNADPDAHSFLVPVTRTKEPSWLRDPTGIFMKNEEMALIDFDNKMKYITNRLDWLMSVPAYMRGFDRLMPDPPSLGDVIEPDYITRHLYFIIGALEKLKKLLVQPYQCIACCQAFDRFDKVKVHVNAAHKACVDPNVQVRKLSNGMQLVKEQQMAADQQIHDQAHPNCNLPCCQFSIVD